MASKPKVVEISEVAVENITERANTLSIAELRAVVSYCCDRIQTLEDTELTQIDQQIAELQAQRMAIRPNQPQLPSNGTGRHIRAMINPANPDERYIRGRRPDWLDQILKDNLGDRYGDQQAEADLIWKLKEGN